MEFRLNDGSQDPDLMKAVGWVMRSSAELSQMLQQLAAVVTGSELVPFAFEDKTLGAQRELCERLVLATNWNPYAPHPPITEEDRATTLDVLRECRVLVDYRNRIAHDVWAVWPTEEVPDAVEGHRPARWGKSQVHSSIRSVRIVSQQIGLAASSISTLEQQIVFSRSRGALRVEGDGTPLEFLRKCADRREGRLADWRWIEVPSGFRPRRENEPIVLPDGAPTPPTWGGAKSD